jgi:hypothetical protein
MRGNPREALGRVFPNELELDVLVDHFQPRLTPRILQVGEKQFTESELLGHGLLIVASRSCCLDWLHDRIPRFEKAGAQLGARVEEDLVYGVSIAVQRQRNDVDRDFVERYRHEHLSLTSGEMHVDRWTEILLLPASTAIT